MPSYLVETYLPRGRAGERTALDQQARTAAEELTHERTRVRFECSISFPRTGSASSSSTPRRAGMRRSWQVTPGSAPFRVVEAIPSEKEER